MQNGFGVVDGERIAGDMTHQLELKFNKKIATSIGLSLFWSWQLGTMIETKAPRLSIGKVFACDPPAKGHGQCHVSVPSRLFGPILDNDLGPKASLVPPH